MKTFKVVDLSRYTSPDVGVVAGRDRAAFMRKENGVEPEGLLRVIVPDRVFCLVPSFVCSLACDQSHVEVEGDEYARRMVLDVYEDHRARAIHRSEWSA